MAVKLAQTDDVIQVEDEDIEKVESYHMYLVTTCASASSLVKLTDELMYKFKFMGSITAT